MRTSTQEMNVANDKMTVEQVRDKVEVEGGLGMAIQDYMRGDSIADPKLAELWDDAAAAIKAVETYIEENAEPEEEPEPEADENVLADGEVLCETAPSIFDGVTKTDDYGLLQIEGKRGGTIRLNPKGGRFENCPEIYFRGDFERAELTEFMRLVRPHIRTDRGQSVRVKSAGVDFWDHVTFPPVD